MPFVNGGFLTRLNGYQISAFAINLTFLKLKKTLDSPHIAKYPE